ncbi:MAG TPA: hypothetical protein VFM74_01710 [Candidatus Limnocylindria bacterium]|nr:hypothetical protein [Candidatus Limnocylindria bacterium]
MFRKKVVTGVAALSLSFGVLAAVGAGGAAAATPSGYCGASDNGCTQSTGNTVCAQHGAFGAFGTYGYIHDFRGGANGDGTAYNNSTLCGNPQGAAGQLGS